MDDRQYRQLRRWFVATWALMFLMVAFCILVFSTSAMTSNNIVAGPAGSTGPQGPMGPQGEIGPAGQTVVVTPPAQVEVPAVERVPIQPSPEVIVGPQGAQGEQGIQGPPGQDGREIELQRNDQTGDLEWRYIGDDFWSLLFKRCELLENCGGD